MQTSNSWTRTNSSNNFLYNAANELNKTSGWYETMFRGYDPAIARFQQVDQLAYVTHEMSPFQYANGNPILYNDPLGLTAEVWDVINDLLRNSTFGGSWSNGVTTTFGSNAEAFYAGSSALDESGGWSETQAGSYEGSAQAYAKITGELVLRSVDIVVQASPYGGASFGGEPYRSSTWLHERLNEATFDRGEYWKTRYHDLLADIGLMPVFGEVADGANAIAYAFEGNISQAGISAFAAIPVMGYATRVWKSIQKHHIIPNAVFKKYATELTNMGWLQKAGSNLKKLPFPFHANHPAYNNWVEEQIELLISQGNFNLKAMSELQHTVRAKINTIYFAGEQKLNDYFKRLGY